jgi:hypothetical protein
VRELREVFWKSQIYLKIITLDIFKKLKTINSWEAPGGTSEFHKPIGEKKARDFGSIQESSKRTTD